jgi:cytochrome oxidase Cu insertion factor (SCO1/SenC/PrrC family)
MRAADESTGDRILWAVLALALMLPVALVLHGAVRRGGPPISGAESAPRLDDYGIVPDFTLIERSGAPLRRADLAGSPWFADFVYTRCSGSCPVISGNMARLRRAVAGRARLVSFSVDPAHDTAEVLSAYAERFSAPRGEWLFVTGSVSDVRRLIGRGFHLAVADPPPGEPELAGAITHSEKVALVDADLRIRRYYDGASDDWIDAAAADVLRLRDAGKGAS